jgi:multicomponent Na+:H+ antiporter subunit E
VKYSISLFAAIAVTWILWSGHFEALLLSLGALSCVIVILVVRRMRILDAEGAPIEVSLRLIPYLPWLFWEIAKANVDVARRILDPRLPISPCIIRVKAGQKRDLGRVIYANSITLTPGTISVDTQGETITVHALTREAAAGVETGEMDRRVSRLEGRRE